jgi:hypothetical protein
MKAFSLVALVSSQCTPLPADTPCGLSFEGQLINRSLDDFNKRFISTPAIQKLFNENGCLTADTSDIQSLRYANSIICQQMIDLDFDKCKSTNTKPNLCRAQCSIASDTLNSLVANPAKCTNAKMFIDMKDRYDVTCSALKNDQACFLAVDDLKYCGFPDEDSQKSMCSTDALANDECCIKFNIDSQKITIIIIAGCAVGVLALIWIVFFIIRRRRSKISNYEDGFRGKHPSGTEINMAAPGRNEEQEYSNEETVVSRQKSILKTQTTLKRKKSIVTFAPDVKSNNPSTAPSEFSEQPQIISMNDYLPNVTAQNQESIEKSFEKQYPSPISPPRVEQVTSPVKQEQVTNSYNIPEGAQEVLVLYDFKSTLPDEITLTKDTKIILYDQFDDGWCLGFDPRSKKQGVFPELCVQIKAPSSRASADSLPDTVLDFPKVPEKPRVSSMTASDLSEGFRKGTRSKVPFNEYINELEKLVEDNEKTP